MIAIIITTETVEVVFNHIPYISLTRGILDALMRTTKVLENDISVHVV